MNNPLVFVDKDGKLWFVPILVGAAIGAAFSAATYTAMVAFTPMTWSGSGFWRAVGMGALGGALGGAAGLAGSSLGIAQAGNSLGYNILSQTTNTLITNAVFGQKTELSDIFGIAVGAAAGSLLPKYKALNAKPLVNTLAETGFNTVRGAATGVVRGGLDAIIHKDARYIYQDAIGGAISGGVKTLMNNLIFGAPYKTVNINGTKGLYRTGGLANIINNRILNRPIGDGLTMGRNMYIRNGQTDINTMNHEGYHIVQQLAERGGWADFYGKVIAEQLFLGVSAYLTPGRLEYDAKIFEDSQNIFVW